MNNEVSLVLVGSGEEFQFDLSRVRGVVDDARILAAHGHVLCNLRRPVDDGGEAMAVLALRLLDVVRQVVAEEGQVEALTGGRFQQPRAGGRPAAGRRRHVAGDVAASGRQSLRRAAGAVAGILRTDGHCKETIVT